MDCHLTGYHMRSYYNFIVSVYFSPFLIIFGFVAFFSISLSLCPPSLLVLYLLLSYASSFPLTHTLFLYLSHSSSSLSLSKHCRRWLSSKGIKVHTARTSLNTLLCFYF
ncbi:hypothetical protein VNO77_00813 [Canavalia gladiata]|uniref:Uncharacterized protein n=1 Tax=Canavalia gladiata TaxID=3824 RepID=A0AAN9MUW5_CANGL